jgi:hypothetical protein
MKISEEHNVNQCCVVETNLLSPSPWQKSKASLTFKMEAAGSSETTVTICHTAQCHVKRRQ